MLQSFGLLPSLFQAFQRQLVRDYGVCFTFGSARRLTHESLKQGLFLRLTIFRFFKIAVSHPRYDLFNGA